MQSGSGGVTYAPLKLRPCYQSYLWGGERLKKEFGKEDAPEITAESWELACHPDGQSRVADGPYEGMSLCELGELDRLGFWGRSCGDGRFPIMVKLIDAKQNLSIQVHPSDATAKPGEQGKAEMWYIVDCEPQAALYLGFSHTVTQTEFLRRAKDGTICQVLNRVPVERGDVFYILPGTIHAIGAGMLIAEIQQSSNTTFRVYDYGRRDASGCSRPLHIERAAEVIDYRPIVPEECRANSGATFNGFTMTQMFACPYFTAYRMDVRSRAKLYCDGERFQHLLFVEGEGEIVSSAGRRTFRRGDSYFMPAALGKYEIAGTCRVLLSQV